MSHSTTSLKIESVIKEIFAASFGDKPEDVHVILENRCLIIRLERFMGKIMENLVVTKDNDALRSTSELIMDYLLPDFMKELKTFSDIEFDSFYYDWDDNNLSGVIVGLIKDNNYRLNEDYYPGKDEVHFQISKITYEVEKVPDSTFSFWADNNTLVVVREGLLIEIEKYLVKLDGEGALRKAKRALEKTRIIEEGNIPIILGRRLVGIYLDWMFEMDKSVIVYVFEEK
ncbi:Na-translocating system protein MpsC family protein [Paenibacillus sp. PK3_47]|uniref:Na-translocating system protein MpsC family protein n=1 Tax=Paenibacillus sp. PK3_47 TaxID=2072642 RepID=UPI00201D9F98|nr:Na-translocating system protein MpsC family protein [Paenibacillus sp. PK3_47]